MAVDTLADKFGTFMRGFVGQLPVYKAGRQIGYIQTTEKNYRQEACAGTFYLYKGEEKGDLSLLYTVDGWGRQIPLSKWCANNGIVPAWLTEAQKTAVVQGPKGDLIIPGVNDDKVTLNLPMVAAAGAVGLGVLLLVLRR